MCDVPVSKRFLSSAPFLNAFLAVYAAGSPRLQRLVLRLLRYCASRTDPADLAAALVKAYPSGVVAEWRAVSGGEGDGGVVAGWLMDTVATPALAASGLPAVEPTYFTEEAQDEFGVRDREAALSPDLRPLLPAQAAAASAAKDGVLRFGSGVAAHALASEAVSLTRTYLRLSGWRAVLLPLVEDTLAGAASIAAAASGDKPTSRVAALLAALAVTGGFLEAVRPGARVVISNSFVITDVTGAKLEVAGVATGASAATTGDLEGTVVQYGLGAQAGATLVVYTRDLTATPVPVDARKLIPLADVPATATLVTASPAVLTALATFIRASSTSLLAARLHTMAIQVLQTLIRGPAALTAAVASPRLLEDLYTVALTPLAANAFVSVAALQAKARSLGARAVELHAAGVLGEASAASDSKDAEGSSSPAAAATSLPAPAASEDDAAALALEHEVHFALAHRALVMAGGHVPTAGKWLAVHRFAYGYPRAAPGGGEEAGPFPPPTGTFAGYAWVQIGGDINEDTEKARPTEWAVMRVRAHVDLPPLEDWEEDEAPTFDGLDGRVSVHVVVPSTGFGTAAAARAGAPVPSAVVAAVDEVIADNKGDVEEDEDEAVAGRDKPLKVCRHLRVTADYDRDAGTLTLQGSFGEADKVVLRTQAPCAEGDLELTAAVQRSLGVPLPAAPEEESGEDSAATVTLTLRVDVRPSRSGMQGGLSDTAILEGIKEGKKGGDEEKGSGLLLPDGDLISPAAASGAGGEEEGGMESGSEGGDDDEGSDSSPSEAGSDAGSTAGSGAGKKKEGEEASKKLGVALTPAARAGLLLAPAATAEPSSMLAVAFPMGNLAIVLPPATSPQHLAWNADLQNVVVGTVVAGPAGDAELPAELVRLSVYDSNTGLATVYTVKATSLRRVASVHGAKWHSGDVNAVAGALVAELATTFRFLGIHAARQCIQSVLVQWARAASDAESDALVAAPKAGGAASVPTLSLTAAGGPQRVLSLVRVVAANDATTAIGRSAQAAASESGGKGEGTGIKAQLAAAAAAEDDGSGDAGGGGGSDASADDDVGGGGAGAGNASAVPNTLHYGMASIAGLRYVLKFLLLAEKKAGSTAAPTSGLGAIFGASSKKLRLAAAASSDGDASDSKAPEEAVAVGQLSSVIVNDCIDSFVNSLRVNQALVAFAESVHPLPAEGVYTGTISIPGTESMELRFDPRCATSGAEVLTLYSSSTMASSAKIASYSCDKRDEDEDDDPTPFGDHKPWPAKPVVVPGPTVWWKLTCGSGRPITEMLEAKAKWEAEHAGEDAAGATKPKKGGKKGAKKSGGGGGAGAAAKKRKPSDAGSASTPPRSPKLSVGSLGGGEEMDDDLRAAIAASLAEAGGDGKDDEDAKSEHSAASGEDDGGDDDAASGVVESEDGDDDDSGADGDGDGDAEAVPAWRRIVRRAGVGATSTIGRPLGDAASVASGESAPMALGALFGGDDEFEDDAPKPAAASGPDAAWKNIGLGTDLWGFAITATPVSGTWTCESHALSHTTASLAWGCWLLDFLLNQVAMVLQRGAVHNQRMYDALVTFLRTRATEARMRSQVITLLSQLLIHPHMFADAPDLDALEGVEEAVVDMAESMSSGSSGRFLPPGLQDLVELVVARRAAKSAFAIAKEALEGKDGAAAADPVAATAGPGVGAVLEVPAGGSAPRPDRLRMEDVIALLRPLLPPKARGEFTAGKAKEVWDEIAGFSDSAKATGFLRRSEVQERSLHERSTWESMYYLRDAKLPFATPVPADTVFDYYDFLGMFYVMAVMDGDSDDEGATDARDKVRGFERWIEWAQSKLARRLRTSGDSDGEGSDDESEEPERPSLPIKRPWEGGSRKFKPATEDLPAGATVQVRVVRPTEAATALPGRLVFPGKVAAVLTAAGTALEAWRAKSGAAKGALSLQTVRLNLAELADPATAGAAVTAGTVVVLQGFNATTKSHADAVAALVATRLPLVLAVPTDAIDPLGIVANVPPSSEGDAVAANIATALKAIKDALTSAVGADSAAVVVAVNDDSLAEVAATVERVEPTLSSAAAAGAGAAGAAATGDASPAPASLSAATAGTMGFAGIAAKLAHARDVAKLNIMRRGVTEKTMSAATTSQFATLAASDVRKGGVASFGSRPMKPGLADFTSLSLVERYMLVHEISAALYENARPRDEVLCTAWADAIGRHRYVETNHPVRAGEVLKGEVELKGASGVKVTFHPRCATDTKAVLTLSWTTGKGVDAVTTTKTFSGVAASEEGSKWPTMPLEVGTATKVSYSFTSPAGTEAAWGVGFTVSGDMSESNLESTVQRQINEVVFASKQLLTQWTREMDADLAALARTIANASGAGKKSKRKRRGSDSGSDDGSDSGSDDEEDEEEAAGKEATFTVEDMPMHRLLLRNELDALQYPSLTEGRLGSSPHLPPSSPTHPPPPPCHSLPGAVPVPQLRMRFQLMVQFNKLLKDALPAFSLSSTKPWSVGYRLRNLSHVVFYEIKKRVLDQAISASKGSGHIDTLYLSNFKASESESRGDVTPEASQCMFVQAYYHLRKVPSAALRSVYDSDQDKVFEVQFRGESGIDAGGVYREVSTALSPPRHHHCPCRLPPRTTSARCRACPASWTTSSPTVSASSSACPTTAPWGP